MRSLLYELLLVAHSYTRWGVLLAALVTLVSATWAARLGRDWRARDQRLARAFVASVDLQVLLGLSLYFGVSPLARIARAQWTGLGWDAFWSQPLLRFFGLIHPLLAVSAAVAAHTAWVLVRRTEQPGDRHRRLAIGAGLSLALFLAAVPWPFLGHERPWFRF